MCKYMIFNGFNKNLTIFSVVFLAFQLAFSEPLRLEQAHNVAEKGQVELGLEGSYGVDEFTLAGLTNTDFKTTTLENAAFLRYGVGEQWELKARFPHVSWETEQDASGIVTSTSESDPGDLNASLKWHMGDPEGSGSLGVAMDFDIPSGDADKALGRGFDVAPTLLLSRRRGNWLKDASVGYEITGDYDVGTTEVKPADILKGGFSLGYRINKWTPLIEARYEQFGKEKQGGAKLANSNGSRIDVTPGLRYQHKNLKFKGGMDLSLGDEDHRFYDWRAFLGVSLLGKFSFKME